MYLHMLCVYQHVCKKKSICFCMSFSKKIMMLEKSEAEPFFLCLALTAQQEGRKTKINKNSPTWDNLICYRLYVWLREIFFMILNICQTLKNFLKYKFKGANQKCEIARSSSVELLLIYANSV